MAVFCPQRTKAKICVSSDHRLIFAVYGFMLSSSSRTRARGVDDNGDDGDEDL